jgi:flagellar biosynthesis regulator FlaF
MENHDRLLSLMNKAVELMRESQEKRREHREGIISDAEANQFLKDYAEKFNGVQRQISEEMRK